MKNPMLDEEFLKRLNEYHHHHTWAKIVSLNFDEYPIDEISGEITSGSINIDGTSKVRRTCSLSMVAPQAKINEYYWGLKTKFELFIGLENFINPDYPDIIWFKQGVFVLTSFSCTVGTNNYSISLQGRDKMSFLNGDLGGIIPASWDFATEDVNAQDENGMNLVDDSGYAVIENRRIPIKQIIQEAVHEFAQEPWQNIIVNDLDDYGIELLEYQGNTPFYYIIEHDNTSSANSREVVNMTLNGDMRCYTDTSETTLSQLDCYESLIDQLDPEETATNQNVYKPTIIKFSQEENTHTYTVAKITSNSGYAVCGYRICDIIYPYDLVMAPGDSVTSMLDKLVEMLGNFEYFYDVEGRFIFQKKRTYLDVSYNNIINEHNISDQVFAENAKYTSKYSYNFEGNALISSVQNSPNYSNLKNDYSLWGSRQNGNVTIPIHMRYSINKKPLYYKVIGHQPWKDSNNNVYHYLGELTDENIGKINFYPGNVYYIRETDDVQKSWNGYPINKQNEFLKGWIVCEKQVNGNGLTFKAEYTYTEGTTIIQPDGSLIAEGDSYTEIPYIFGWNSNEIKDSFKKYGYFFTDAGYVYWTNEAKDKYNNAAKYPVIAFDRKKHILVDWREIIYQMANDYRRHYHDIDFLETVRKNNMYNQFDSFYPNGKTGYEQYYIDFEMNLSQGVVAYWRELYNPEQKNQTGRYLANGEFLTIDNEYADSFDENHTYKAENKDGIEETIKGYPKDAKVNFTDNKGKIRYWKSKKDNNEDKPIKYIFKDDASEEIKDIIYSVNWVEVTSFMTYNSEGWNVDILENPEILNFWFDFIDTEGELGKYGVNHIGLRSKATNDDKIKAIYFREVPNVIFEASDKETRLASWTKPGYCYVKIPDAFMGLFNISSRGKNMMDVVEDYLYSYTYPASSITLTSIPIYYLAPNTLIYVYDQDTGIAGEYIMQKYSLQLGLNASMSISAIETAKRIY